MIKKGQIYRNLSQGYEIIVTYICQDTEVVNYCLKDLGKEFETHHRTVIASAEERWQNKDVYGWELVYSPDSLESWLELL